MNISEEIANGINELLHANLLLCDALPEDLSDLQEMVLASAQQYLVLEKEVSDLKAARAEAAQRMLQVAASAPADISITNIQKLLEENLEVKRAERAEDFYRTDERFKELISTENGNVEEQADGDDDLAVTQQATQTVDPCTKAPLQDPVKNKHCGHSYEKSTVLQMMRNNPRHRCPYMGCNNRRVIQESDLVPNEQLKRALARQRLAKI